MTSQAPVVRTTITTRFADLDPLGHVNNVAFLTYLETGRVRYFQQVSRVRSALVARLECDLKAEIGADVREVHVSTVCESVGRTSFTLRHELEADGRTAAVGRTVVVKLGEDRRPAPLTDEERAAFLG